MLLVYSISLIECDIVTFAGRRVHWIRLTVSSATRPTSGSHRGISVSLLFNEEYTLYDDDCYKNNNHCKKSC